MTPHLSQVRPRPRPRPWPRPHLALLLLLLLSAAGGGAAHLGQVTPEAPLDPNSPQNLGVQVSSPAAPPPHLARTWRRPRHSPHFPLCSFCCNCCNNRGCGFCCRT